MKMTNHQLPISNRRTAVQYRLAACGTCLVALLLACESGVEQYKPEPNVHCLIGTNEGSVTLMAGMTVGYYDSVSDANQWQGTSGVVVGIGHRGSVTALSAVADSPGYYRTDSLPIVPGDSYSLSVTYPGGARVTGSTIVPDKVSFSLRVDSVFEIPWPGDTFIRPRLTYAWSESRGAVAYLEQVDVWYRSVGDSSVQRYGPILTDSRQDTWSLHPFYYQWDTLSGEVVDSLPLDRVTVEVKAIDRNNYDYVSLGYTGAVDPDKMHLEGGLGVFGSACAVDSTIWFQPAALKSAPTSRFGN